MSQFTLGLFLGDQVFMYALLRRDDLPPFLTGDPPDSLRGSY